jgi:hypothetical protein
MPRVKPRKQEVRMKTHFLTILFVPYCFPYPFNNPYSGYIAEDGARHLHASKGYKEGAGDLNLTLLVEGMMCGYANIY